MQVLCEKSKFGSEVRCAVCGQGFLVYWGRTPRPDLSQARADVMQVLRKHHEGRQTIDGSHPDMRFSVPCRAEEMPNPAPWTLGAAPAYAL